MSSGLDPETWGTLPTLFMGAAFTLGLVLVLIAGSDLATGNMMLVPLSAMRGKIGMGDVVRNLTLVLLGNLLGALFVAFFLAVQTDVIGDAGSAGSALLTYERLASIAEGKTGHTRVGDVPARRRLQLAGLPGGVDVAGGDSRSRGRSWPSSSRSWPSWRWASTTSSPTCSSSRRRSSPTCPASAGATPWSNWLLAGLGNLVGAVVFVATSYWYLFLRDKPEKVTAAEEPAERA